MKRTLGLAFLMAALMVAGYVLVVGPRSKADQEGLQARLEEFSEYAQKGGDRLPSPVSLHSVVRMIDGKAHIEFAMTNITDKPIQTIEIFLPWGRKPVTLFAAFTPRGNSLRLGYAPDNPVEFKAVTIEPGQTLRGNYQISRNAWEIDDFYDEDVILLWRYVFSESRGWREGMKHPPHQPIVGVTVVPKSRMKQALKP